jgi:hypothetical protein
MTGFHRQGIAFGNNIFIQPILPSRGNLKVDIPNAITLFFIGERP